MIKKNLHKSKAKLRWLSPWYFLVAALIFGSVSLVALRHNNLEMVKLRDQVFAADKAGGDVETALRNLREFIYAHMNTNLTTANGVKPPIQLKYTYDRLLKAQQANLQAKYSKIYDAAQAYCRGKYPYSVNRLPCVESYVKAHGVKPSSTISEDLYKFDFVSPTWTPDLAGWTLLAAAISLLLFGLTLGIETWLKHELHNQM